MISNTNAAGVYTDADHNATKMSIIDLFEPAGMFSGPSIAASGRLIPKCRYHLEGNQEGYYPLADGGCNPISENKTTLYVR